MVEIEHSDVFVDDAVVHVAQAGHGQAPTLLMLHGWPESWRTWRDLMAAAAETSHVVAIDLPGIGGSTGRPPTGTKREIAAVVHRLISAMGLRQVVLVGHDIGGMVTYAYVREFHDLRGAVIMDVPIPGVEPWDEFTRQPFLWHFALHAVPDLPEQLVTGRQSEYFGYFFDLLSAHDGVPSAASRAEEIAAYSSPASLAAGFDWYRAFAADVADNQSSSSGPPTATPLLYLRGQKERGGSLEPYVEGLRRSGVTNVQGALVPDAGHFPQEEATTATWRLISEFVSSRPAY
jgi:pimeloyl-ACP methyl ester carboxylesterase